MVRETRTIVKQVAGELIEHLESGCRPQAAKRSRRWSLTFAEKAQLLNVFVANFNKLFTYSTIL